MPGSALVAFVYLIAAWALVTGALMIAAAFRLHLDHGRWWLGIGGALSVLFAIALIASPALSLLVLTYWMGGYAIAFGPSCWSSPSGCAAGMSGRAGRCGRRERPVSDRPWRRLPPPPSAGEGARRSRAGEGNHGAGHD